MTSVIQIMSAVDSREAADRLAERLLEARLAACVQIIGPVSSRYWWNGSIERAEEWLCLFKTRRELYFCGRKGHSRCTSLRKPGVAGHSCKRRKREIYRLADD